jgi:hypothetical protein
LALSALAWAGPIEFGQQELQRAIAARKLAPALFRVQLEVSTAAPESFRILPGRISGGDRRGLMYGLIEAAEQVQNRGYLLAASGAAAMPIRGVRIVLQAEDLKAGWYNSRQQWQDYFAMLARSRFNRLNLVYADAQAAVGSIEMLRFITQTAADYSVDVTLGLQNGNQLPVPSHLSRVLAECATIRAVQIWNPDLKDGLFAAVREAGRRVTLELRSSDLSSELLAAAAEDGTPVRVSNRFGMQGPALPFKPASAQLIWDAGRAGAPDTRTLTDPNFVRRTVPMFSEAGYSGFEIDAPQTPGSEGEQLFYLLWGRLSYNPKTPESVWSGELKKR